MTVSGQNNAGLIYGTITTKSDKTYTGAIRWGKEETFCDDHFNSRKSENTCMKYLSKEEIDQLIRAKNKSEEKWDWEFMNLWIDKKNSEGKGIRKEQKFASRFGDLRKIKVLEKNSVGLEFKNGEWLKVSGGSNDIGCRLKVWDQEKGEKNIEWHDLHSVAFREAPATYTVKIGEPLFGAVKTLKGEFRGLIQWDQEECLTTDKLNGEMQRKNGNDQEDDDVAFLFEEIRSIESMGDKSRVSLKSGKVIELWGNGDVNGSNKGIIIKNPDFGKVLLEWDDFISVTFFDKPLFKLAGYTNFTSPRNLSGTVSTSDGKTLSGKIIFDLDEISDFEILDGMDGSISYSIPFRDLKRIKPKNEDFTFLEMKSGKKLVLGGSDDVTKQNDGILIFDKDKEEPTYVPWAKVEEIVFK